MECNKEEAVRAMQLSEIKIQSNDFTGARKMAQKAQRLFPELENVEKLLTVCEVHCSSENKIGGSEMDWYGILQIQKFDNDATIKKQYRKLALLLHPDKNKFSGAEAAFKLIGEANRVLADQAKRSVYDMKCRALAKTGAPKPSTHLSNGNLFVRKHNNTASNIQNIPQSQYTSMNQHQQAQPETFWTCCPFCKIKYQYHQDFANRLLRCQKCRRAFVAHDLGIQFQVHPESVRNQFPNRKEPPSQGASDVASQSNGGTGNPSSTKYQNGNAASNPLSKMGFSDDVSMDSNSEKKDIGHGVGMSKSGPVKSKDSEISRNKNKKRGRNSIFESSESCKTGNRATSDSEHVIIQEKVSKLSEPNGGNHNRRSSRKKQNLSYNENLNDDDFVSPPKRWKDSQLSSGVSKTDGSTDAATTASVGGHKNEAEQNVTAPLEECSPSKRSKPGEFEKNVKEAAMPDNDDGKLNADVGPGPSSNVASMPASVEVPDPEFNKFGLGEDMLENVFSANQTWALYDPVDGMPRFYARVKKVFTPGFKVRFTWLESNPDDQGEIAWCNKELPVACGKYTLGHTQEVTDHLMFSHQMHCIKGSGRSSFFVYPRKGETWALYQNWDIGWSSEPEKHVPYKFEFVEVVSDFDENNGVGVAYLGKVKGFVSLFQRSEQHGVILLQVPRNELYRFSHRIPSFKMTGDERDGVPKESFEFDPASLPTNLDDFIDLKKGNRAMNTEPNGLSREFLESEGKPVMGSGRVCAAEKQGNSERETSMRRSPRKANSQSASSVKLEATRCDLTQPTGSASACQSDEIIKTPKKHLKNDSDRETFRLRRSPRDLSKNSTRANVTMKRPDSTNDESHPNFTPSKINSTSSQSDDRMHSSVKDLPSVGSMKSPVTPPSSSPACRLSQTQFYDFDGQKSEEKFQLGQIWALYSERSGMPKTYAQLKRIESKPNFQLHIALLEPCLEPEGMSEPVCCGTFKVKGGQTKVFPRTSFSHCLKAKPVGKKNFEINPRKGEVWALYKNHNPELAYPNLGKGESEIVEVLEDNDQSTKVVVLAKLNGYKSVYRAPRIHRLKTGVIDIPRAEIGRFSHQIPAFQHTMESDSRLAGYWELDPLSIPGITTILN